MTVGYVLGGGGVRGAVEVGMLRALFDAHVTPDLIVGTSIGALNGAAVAMNPSPSVIATLERAWNSPIAGEIYGEWWPRQLRRLAKSRTHLNNPAPLRTMIVDLVGEGRTFADTAVPFAVCAASIERAAETWFDEGPMADAILASASVPAALPPTLIDGEHYIDGGVVNSIPLGEAIRRGATEIYVLQVGRIEEPLSAPEKPSDVAKVAFEISRRHRFARDMADVPAGVTVHVLPSGGSQEGDEKLTAFKNLDTVTKRMETAYEATAAYLADHLPGHADAASQAQADDHGLHDPVGNSSLEGDAR
ncbi:patatin-like phospholipase family protein [Demequina sp. B12]|uniref:patatin-like phospholipase family protein n=1 Tax=Demequina sp. B12 TaxID=2992757 RepID=UPI00237AA1DA|nr:patatin-like phospholipase family protein [Demequina sp. B12]MDE0573453.1 patatin-like phospholipase family protein [Demequina sp. B12]